MQVIRFMILSVIWLADMAWLVAIAPIGEHPLLFSVLFTFTVTAVEFKTGGFQEIHWLKLKE